MKSPLVSVIVPIYGVEKYVGQCVESLINQTYNNLELIFVNDKTKDGSIDVLNQILGFHSHDNIKYKIVNHETNRGLAAARITGLQSSTGDYILHLDSDDWLEPSMVAEMVMASQKQNADIVVCGIIKRYIDKEQFVYPTIYGDKDQYIKDILFKYTPGSMWGKLIKRAIYNHPDVWPIEGINHGEDYATVPRMLYYTSKIVFLKKCLYNYNLQNQSSYTKNFSETSMHSMMKADKVLIDFFKDKYDESDIALMKLRTKTGMIKRGNHKLFNKISRLYNDIPLHYYRRLKLIDLCLLISIKCGCGKLVGYLINKYLKTI